MRSRLRAEARQEAEKWHEGKAGKEELVGEGGAKLPDWEGQPIRNLRSIKLGVGSENSLVFHRCPRAFLLPLSLRSILFFFFFLIPVLALPCCSFIRPSRSSSQPLFAFEGTRRYLPLDSPSIWILTGDKPESNEISTSFTAKVCLILKYRSCDDKLLNARANRNHTE